MKKRPRKKKKSALFIVFIVLTVGLIAYVEADRYLIEHVEIDLNAVTATATASSTTSGDASDDATASAEITPDQTYTATETSYISGSKSIVITTGVTGSGSKQATYYVADITLTDATQLKSAFAENKFGTNIIDYVSNIAEENDAILAINGDYYGFRDDGIIIRNGVIYRDEPAREGLAFYLDGTMKVYDETETTAEELLAGGVWNTLSFGPTLLEDGEIVSGIDDVEIDTNFGNHSIQGRQPRTGVGIISANHFVFVVVDGRSSDSSGVTMTQFAQIFKDLGCTTAYNLDGGGSSEMYFMGNIVNTPQGTGKERGTSDILYIA